MSIEYTPPVLAQPKKPTQYPYSASICGGRIKIHFASDLRFEPDCGDVFEHEGGPPTTPLNEPVTFTLVAEDGREFPRMMKLDGEMWNSHYRYWLAFSRASAVKVLGSGTHIGDVGTKIDGEWTLLTETVPLPTGTRTTITITPDHRIECVIQPPEKKSAFPMTLEDMDGDEVSLNPGVRQGYLVLTAAGEMICLDDDTAPAFRDAIDTWIQERKGAANVSE